MNELLRTICKFGRSDCIRPGCYVLSFCEYRGVKYPTIIVSLDTQTMITITTDDKRTTYDLGILVTERS